MISGTTTANDEAGLVVFGEMAKETLKMDILLSQNKDLSTKMKKITERTQRKGKKELVNENHLCREKKSTIGKNKLLKENLQGKSKSRRMTEQMTIDLERQLHLERKSIDSKVAGYMQAELKGTNTWKCYMVEYLGSEEAKCMLDVQKILVNTNQHLEQLGHVKQSLENEHHLRLKENANKRNAQSLKTAELTKKNESAKSERDAVERDLQQTNEELNNVINDVNTLKNKLAAGTVTVVNQEKDVSEASDQTSMSFRDRLNSMLQSNAVPAFPSLPELPVWDEPMILDEPQLQDVRTYNDINMENDTEEVETNLCITASNDLPSQPSEVCDLQEQTPAMPEEVITQECAVDETVTTENNPSEIPIESEDPVAEQIEEQVVECQPEPTSDAVVETSQEEEREQEAPEQFPQEIMLQDDPQETASQVGSNYSDGEMAPHMNSGVSECSETSSLELLNDEKRHAYMKKLMASPEYSIPQTPRLMYNSSNIQSQQRNVGPQTPNYVNNSNQSFQMSEIDDTCAFPNTNTQSEVDSSESVSENQQMQGMQDNMSGVGGENMPYDCDQSSSASFTNMNALYELNTPESNASQEETPFGFGGFSFEGTAKSGNNDFFGGSSLFGESPSQKENSPFGSEIPTQSNSFTMNFGSSSTSSTFLNLF